MATTLSTAEFIEAAMAFAARVERAASVEASYAKLEKDVDQLKVVKNGLQGEIEKATTVLADASSAAAKRKTDADKQAEAAIAFAEKKGEEIKKNALDNAAATIADADNRARSAKIDVDKALKQLEGLNAEIAFTTKKLNTLRAAHDAFKKAAGV